MKCETCGNEYPTQYYFSTPTVCSECFSKIPPDEQKRLYDMYQNYGSLDTTYTRIGFGPRLGAALIDIVFTWILMLIAIFVTGMNEIFSGSFIETITNQSVMQDFQKEFLPIAILIGFLYYSMEIFLAATPGKLILGLQIANDDGKRASMGKLFLRFSVKNVSNYTNLLFYITASMIFSTIGSVLGIIILVGFFFVLSKNKQAFHDMLAKTAVYKRNAVLD
jgi:uncharacterized RDD family membrane protein YckC